MNILLIGCGKMGGAMLRQWAGSDANHFTVADPTVPDLPEGLRHVSKATELAVAKLDVVLIATKPKMITAILPDYAHFEAGRVFRLHCRGLRHRYYRKNRRCKGNRARNAKFGRDGRHSGVRALRKQ